MHHLSKEEKAEATVNVLQHLGKLIQHAQGDNGKNPMIGAITLTFHESGATNLGYVGSLERANTLGALLDAALSFREMVDAKQLENEMVGLFESMIIPDNQKN